MFISRFNRYFDKHGRTTYLILGLFISFSFVIFVGPRSCSPSDSRSRMAPVGEMYGKTINPADFHLLMRQTNVSSWIRTGRRLDDRGREDVLVSETLKRMRSLREAEARGLGTVGDEEIRDTVRKNPFFHEDGRFSKDSMSRFLSYLRRQDYLTPADFDRVLRDDIVIARLEAEVLAGVHVTPGEVREQYDRFNEEFVIRTAEFAADVAADGNPSDAEVDAYFAEHKADLRLPDRKRIRVAEFSASQYLSKVTLTDADLQANYDKLKESAYKGKTFEDVKDQIAISLKETKAHGLANKAATEMAGKLGERPEGETAAELAARFAKSCEEVAVTPKDSEPFEKTGKLAGIGAYPNLQRVAYELREDAPLTDVVMDSGSHFVACWLETIPGAAPTELVDSLRSEIRDQIIEKEARALYADKVEPFRAKLEGAKQAWDVMDSFSAEVRLMAGKSDEERGKLLDEYRERVRTYLVPYYVPQQKRVNVAVFSPVDFVSKAKIGDEMVDAYYNEHLEEYSKEEVRARQILMRVPATASDEEKGAVRGKMDAALARVREGTSFIEVAKELSEDFSTRSNGGDMGFFARGDRDPAIEGALFGMEVGQISDVLETRAGFVVVKLEDKRQGRALKEVAGEIRTKLMESASEELAIDAASAFIESYFAAAEKAGNEPGAAAGVFATVGEEKGVAVKESELFREGGFIAPFGYEPELGKAAFALTPDRPVSEIVKGRRDVYVACLTETVAGYLPALGDDKGLLLRVMSRARRERAIAAARGRAASAREALVQAVAAGNPDFSQAIGGVEFKASDAFSRYNPLSGVANAREIMESLDDLAGGTVAETMETDEGAIVYCVISRVLPADEDFEAEKDKYATYLNYMKQNGALQAFHARLQAESDTRLSPEWAPKENEVGML